jgi:PAS domain S-box-containing protein
MLGYSAEEWLSRPDFWLSIVHPDDRERTERQAAQAFASGKSSVLQFRWIDKEGQPVWVESHTDVIEDNEGRPIAMRAVTMDISERKRIEDALRHSEEQLRQSQKLDAIGQLAGGVAHDFNNLLTAINGYSQIVSKQLRPEDPLRLHVEEIRRAGDRAASLTRQLLAFSRKQVMQPRVLDLKIVVSEMEKMLCRLIGEDIELRTVMDAGLGNIKADPGQIEQVILNLAVNARDAMPNGGKLMIEAQNVYLDEEFATNHIAAVPGPYVRLSVSDSGSGMDKETKARLFEPFFTTKEVGKGTGLGLSTVYGIVKQSGGNIWFYSEVGEGTTFKVYLPRVDETAQLSISGAESEDDLRGSETILLAEDDEMVRSLVRGVLKTYGYKVLDAMNGGGAFLICERHEHPIHLLLTDVIMPEMSGSELADRLILLKPEMKVLYMSGYTDNAIVNQGILDSEKPFLQKPFTPDILAHKVREVLDAR